MNCIACKSSNLIEGNILDESGGMKLSFKPLEVSMWKAVFGIGVQDITAVACVHCGNLQLNVNFSDEDRRRYLEQLQIEFTVKSRTGFSLFCRQRSAAAKQTKVCLTFIP